MPPQLTAARLRLLRVTAQLARQGQPPTLSSLALALGISKQGASDHLRALRALGLIAPAASRYAPLQLTDRARALIGDGAFPVVGEIAAGPPAYAEQDVERYLERLDDALELQPGDYFLRVRGDSMLGLGIYPGDLVAVRPADTCTDGEIVVVLLPGEQVATLKRMVKRGGAVVLHSENPSYPPMHFPAEDVRVQGCLIGVVGSIRARQLGRQG